MNEFTSSWLWTEPAQPEEKACKKRIGKLKIEEIELAREIPTENIEKFEIVREELEKIKKPCKRNRKSLDI